MRGCIFIHAIHACVSGMKKILIRTVNRDVVVLAIAFEHQLETDSSSWRLPLALARTYAIPADT